MKLTETNEYSITREEESAMMRDVAARDDTAFAALCRQYRALIYVTVYRVINNPQDAEDITQEVLLSIWKKADTWDVTKGKLATWIAAIARNRAIDTIRSKQRRAALHEKMQKEERMHDAASLEDSAREQVLHREARLIARSALVELNPAQREAIELAYLEGLTQTEVAQRIGVPVGTAKARIRRGVQKLRETIPRRINA